MKRRDVINEKTYNRNIKLIEKYSRDSLSEYYVDRRLYLNLEKYQMLAEVVNELVDKRSEVIERKRVVYAIDEHNYVDQVFENDAIVVGSDSSYAYRFENCSFHGCTFYLMSLDVSFIFENCTVDQCELKCVAHLNKDVSLDYVLWCTNIKGLCHITLNFHNSRISDLKYWFGEVDQAVVSISSNNSIIERLSIYSKRIQFLDAYKPESTFSDCTFFGDIITMTLQNNQLRFNDCLMMISELSQIEYKELNDVLEVIKRIIKMEHDDKRLDALKILYDALYNSDSISQTWLGFVFGYLRMPKVIIKNAITAIILFAVIYMVVGIENNGVVKYSFSLSGKPLSLFINFINSFVESLYFSCCTFTTVGYGDFQINSRITMFKIIPIIQMILGYIFSGVMIGSFYHKMSSRRYKGSNY